VPLEGVVHALHQIHAALRAGGAIVDTQPVSAHPPVQDAAGPLGRIDMREWLDTVEAVDALVEQTIDEGLYSIAGEQRLTVADTWNSGPECADAVSGWQGTRLSSELADRVAAGAPPLTVPQEVRLRIMIAR
jgi:hypothetical protein